MQRTPPRVSDGDQENQADAIIQGLAPPTPGHNNGAARCLLGDPLPMGSEISRVAVKVPPFWRNNPALWFKQVESQFITSGITSDSTKFHTIVGSIDASILSEVSDLILNPPESNMYETLKKNLQERFMDSEERRLKRLLRDIEIGDKKPSAVLREMMCLASGKVSDELLKSLWMQRLPKQTQAILSVSSESLSSLSIMADKIADTAEAWDINAITSQSASTSTSYLQSLEMKIEALTKQMEVLSRHTRSRSKSRNRATGKSNSKPSCWYHFKFGDRATKCVQPCTFSPNTSTEN